MVRCLLLLMNLWLTATFVRDFDGNLAHRIMAKVARIKGASSCLRSCRNQSVTKVKAVLSPILIEKSPGDTSYRFIRRIDAEQGQQSICVFLFAGAHTGK